MQQSYKPKAIIRFEWLFLSGAALWFIAFLSHFSLWRAHAGAAGALPPIWTVALGLGLVAGINGFMWFFIARRGSNVVRWLLCLFQVYAVLEMPASWAEDSQVGKSYALLLASSTILQTAALLVLCGSGARLWLSHKGRNPETASDVFA